MAAAGRTGGHAPGRAQHRTARYWCEWALLGTDPGAAAATAGVLVEVGAGVVTAVSAGTDPPADAERLSGVTVPGLANVHSHAFHRALRGRTGENGGSFWTWRKQMYRVAERLDPDSYHRLARGVYAEMALAGVTCVGEFHYLHHGPGGTPYDDPNAMSAALVAAAADAGIRITLLDTCYLSGGLTPAGAHLPLEGPQLRFGDGSVDAWAERVADFRPDGGRARVGAAAHSVRAVPLDAIRRLTGLQAHARWPAVHVHLSEQPAENAACRAAYGRTPTRVLFDTGLLGDPPPTLVHATHLAPEDAALIRNARAGVCLCPTTERDLADGLPALAGLAGVPVTLGSDGHSTIDMFEEARSAEMHERLRTGRRGTLSSAVLLNALLAAGHAALGWSDGRTADGRAEAPAGRIAPGFRADLVTLDLNGIRLAGFDPDRAADAVVFAATASDVRHVMADGRWIVRDRVHTAIPAAAADLDAVIQELA